MFGNCFLFVGRDALDMQEPPNISAPGETPQPNNSVHSPGPTSDSVAQSKLNRTPTPQSKSQHIWRAVSPVPQIREQSKLKKAKKSGDGKPSYRYAIFQ